MRVGCSGRADGRMDADGLMQHQVLIGLCIATPITSRGSHVARPSYLCMFLSTCIPLYSFIVQTMKLHQINITDSCKRLHRHQPCEQNIKT